jgi:hypothetical protein
MIYTSLYENPLYVFLNRQTACFIQKRRFVDNIEVLGEEVVYRSGSFMRIKRWLRGVHPKLGTIVHGVSGWETLVEKDVIKPLHTFYIHENTNDADQALLRRTDSQCPEPIDTQEKSQPHGMDGDAVLSDQGSPPALIQAS